MIVEILVICFLARLKRYKLRYLFYSWTFYPILFVQVFLIICELSIFLHTDYLIKFASIAEPAIILSFIFSVLVFRLYRPAIIGSVSIVIGTALNKFVIAQNGGKMPVFPSLSYITGYINPDMFGGADPLHILGGETTKFKILTDFIDFGYCILSIGDVFIHLFFCIMLCSLIKAVNIQYAV